MLMKDVGFLAAEFPTQYLAQHLSRLGLYLGVNIISGSTQISSLMAYLMGGYVASTFTHPYSQYFRTEWNSHIAWRP